ncbi:MAG: prepilin-type N-terminal cleavage/methylation domain-containing protein [Phycisphaeraceae bacterium]
MDQGNRSIPGYSLVELLVTLVIVAGLLGLLLPALQRARMSANETACLRNNTSNGRSFLLHAFERDGRFPPMFHAFSPGQSGKIMVRVHPRTPREAGIHHIDKDLLVCPADQGRGTVPVREEAAVTQQVMSYGYNVELPIRGATLDDLTQPRRTAVLYDGSMSGPGRGKNVEGVYDDSYEFVAKAHTRRHNRDETAIVLFADWHASSVDQIAPEQVLLP